MSTALSTETSRATSSEASLTTRVSTETSRATAAEASLSTSDVSLSTALSTETSRAISSETSINVSLSTALSVGLSTETSRASSVEVSLSTSLSSEVSRATSSESVLRQNAAWSNLVPCSQSVYADELAPMVMPSSYLSYNLDGWYFKNPAINKKANWYVPPCGLTMGQLEYLCFGYLPIANNACPYINIFTIPNSTDVANGKWYNSRLCLDTITATNLTQTYAYGSINGSTTLSTPTIPGFTSVPITSSGLNNVGSWSSSDQILYIVFNAGDINNQCPAGGIELILHEINLITPTGTISNKFSNDSVVNMYAAKQISALYAYLFDVSSNIIAPPVTAHSGFTTNTTALYYAKQNYNSATGEVTATYQTL